MNKQSIKKFMALVHGGVVLCGALIFASDQASGFPISTGTNPYRAHIIPEIGNVAIFGYDPVAYFIEGRAVKGKDEFEHEFGNVRWHFSSAENRDVFIGGPESYLPQYGGFCAVCIVEHEDLFDANPKIWSIIKGKLYLNNDLRSREKFRRNASLYIQWADEVWAKLAPPAEPGISDPLAYKMAVLNPGFNYSGQPWGAGVSSLDETFLGLAGDIYRAIQEQSSISISFADEPPDPSARSEVNRGGDWPFPETSVDRKVVWEWETDRQYMTPNLEQVYQAGRELGVDGVVMYYFKPIWRFPQWPVEVYVIDIEQQRVYAHKGTNTETSTLVTQAFSDFVAGRKP